jgi:hypothetical protein
MRADVAGQLLGEDGFARVAAVADIVPGLVVNDFTDPAVRSDLPRSA